MGNLGHAAHIHVFGQGHAAAMDGENLLAPDTVRNRDGDLAVEPARPAQSRIEHVRQICGGNHDEMLALV